VRDGILGRDSSCQIREVKDHFGGSEWPHWPGENFLSRT